MIGVSCSEYRRDGAFAEFVAVPARSLCRIPDNVTFEQAALVEAVSVAVHAVGRTPLTTDSKVAVIGTGMIGLLIVQVLKARRCASIIAIDIDESRLEMARCFGATETIHSGSPDVREKVSQSTKGRGADAAFEVVGRGETLKLAVDCVRKGASITLVGNLTPNVELPLQTVVTRQLTLIGTCASAGEYPESLGLIAGGKVDVTTFVSATSPLEGGARWFERLYAG